MTADATRAILPEPPEELKELSRRLSARIRERIRERGPLPFGDYMEAALYEPGLGYYSAGLQKFGPGGDFVTAPELGQVFGRCLARQVAEIGAAIGQTNILEVGAGSGRLAATLLTALNRIDNLPQPRYHILERSAHLRQQQRETLDSVPGGLTRNVRWLDEPPRNPWNGIVIANEVVDALPVERFRTTGNGLEQMNVIADGAAFDWMPGPARRVVEETVAERLGERLEELPTGYCSEVNVALGPWLEALTRALERGCVLLVDYGYTRDDYYHPHRRQGTLISHYRHRAVDDPFRWPGLQDITAFVDFTALAEAAAGCGLSCAGYTTQAMFLLGCGLDEEVADLTDLPVAEQMQLTAEVRQLTLPSEMGEKFQVMALTRQCDAALRGFAALDLRHRLQGARSLAT